MKKYSFLLKIPFFQTSNNVLRPQKQNYTFLRPKQGTVKGLDTFFKIYIIGMYPESRDWYKYYFIQAYTC